MENEDLHFRPLGTLKNVLEGLGEEVSYAYDDLIFIQHNNYLLQFGETAELILFFRNGESNRAETEQQFSDLVNAGEQKGLEIVFAGEYSLVDNDDETISIEFVEVQP